MTPEQFNRLERGDLVRHVGHGDAWVVDGRYGDCVVIVRTMRIVNPDEWDCVGRANYENAGEIEVEDHSQADAHGGVYEPDVDDDDIELLKSIAAGEEDNDVESQG